MKDIFRTAFWTALVSYLLFVVADFCRPGFVSYVFSVHWFAAAAIIFGALFVLLPSTARFKPADRWFGPYAMALAVGAILAVMLWRTGEVFGDWRVFLSLAALVGPTAMLRLFKIH
jgi:hypothetical protein